MQHCDEAAYLSEILLWRNGISVDLDCNPAENRNIKQMINYNTTATGLTGYPNPANDEFILVSETRDACEIYVYDPNGRMVNRSVYPENTQKLSVNTSHFLNGFYFVEIRAKGSPSRFLKFVVQH